MDKAAAEYISDFLFEFLAGLLPKPIDSAFCWDEVRRAQFRAPLDAYYARLYGLTRDELRYTPLGVDPKEVHGKDPSIRPVGYSGQVSLGRLFAC